MLSIDKFHNQKKLKYGYDCMVWCKCAAAEVINHCFMLNAKAISHCGVEYIYHDTRFRCTF